MIKDSTLVEYNSVKMSTMFWINFLSKNLDVQNLPPNGPDDQIRMS